MLNANKKTLRNFGIAFGAAWLIAGLRWSVKWHNPGFLFLAGVGALIILCGLIRPFFLLPLYKTMSAAFRFLINMLFVLAFYLVFAPVGIFMKITGKDLLGLRIDRNKASYWEKKAVTPTNKSQYEKQF